MIFPSKCGILVGMKRNVYVLSDDADELYDVRVMDQIDLDRAQLIIREATDGARYWRRIKGTDNINNLVSLIVWR